MADKTLSLEASLSDTHTGADNDSQGGTPYATPEQGAQQHVAPHACIVDVLAAARDYDTLPRTAKEQLIEQLGVMRQQREAEWHPRAFPINHPKNYNAVPTPDAKKAMDALVRIYNDACMTGDSEIIALAGKARGLNPLVIFADAHPAKVRALGLAGLASVFYAVSQVGTIGDYLGK
jgi:hypothetical protein